MSNQFLISANQWTRITDIYHTCDYVITDSPLLLGLVYDKNSELNENLNQYLIDLHNSLPSVNFLIQREVNDYQNWGRIHDETESQHIEKQILNLPIKFHPIKKVEEVFDFISLVK